MYKKIVQALPHAQIEKIVAQVASIADEQHLTDDASSMPEDEGRLGKREYHNALPDEVKAKRSCVVNYGAASMSVSG